MSLIGTALVMLAATAAPLPAARPVILAPVQRDSLVRVLEQSRAETVESLRSGSASYFAAVQRVDFGKVDRLVVGSAADCDVRIADPEMPAHALSVTVAGDSFRVAALDTASFLWRHLAYREASLGPAGIEFGRWTLRLSHQRFPAVIVFDPRSPRMREFHGLEFFPPDMSYRFETRLVPDPSPDTVVILSTRGNQRRALRVGWFDLAIAGRRCRLEANRLLEPGVDESSISIFFRDATTGRETYGVGRYVDPEPLPDGRWRIDFNDAYNPACAFSPYYNCPLPPRANTLPVAVRAGEKDSHYAH